MGTVYGILIFVIEYYNYKRSLDKKTISKVPY